MFASQGKSTPKVVDRSPRQQPPTTVASWMMPVSDRPADRVNVAHLTCPKRHDDVVDMTGLMVYCKDCGLSDQYSDCIDIRERPRQIQTISIRVLAPRIH